MVGEKALGVEEARVVLRTSFVQGPVEGNSSLL